MRRIFAALASFVLVGTAPGFVSTAFAHGGSYRGPAGEVPPDSREPSDPPPPPESGGPSTPAGENPTGPTTGGPDTGGPSTGGDGGAPTTGGGPSSGGPSSGGSGPSGPTTGGAGKPKPVGRGTTYDDWTFWWNFNKDELLLLKQVLKRNQAGVQSGGSVHRLGPRGGDTKGVKTATDKAIQEQIVPVLEQMLGDASDYFDVRASSAVGLAKIGDEKIIETIKKMAGAGDQHKVIQESAALSFGLLQANTDEVRDFLIELVQDTNRKGNFVRPFAAVSLGLLGVPEDKAGGATSDRANKAAAALLAVVRRKETGQDIKPMCLLSLGLMGDDTIVPDLMAMLQTRKAGPGNTGEDLDDLQLSFVVQALGKIGQVKLDKPGDETAVLDAVQRIVEKDKAKYGSHIRRSAAIALGQLAPRTNDPKVQDRVVKALSAIARETDDAQERNLALISLGRIGATPGIPAAMRKECIERLSDFLREGKPANLVQPFAAMGLGLIGRQIAVIEGLAAPEHEIRAPLRKKFEEEKNPKARGAYAVASGLVRDVLAVPALVQVLKDRGMDKRARSYCALGLGMIGDDSAAEAIKSVLTEEADRDLRVQAAVAAGLLGDVSVIEPLIKILEDKDSSEFELASAALALGQIGDENSIPKLISIVKNEKKSYPELARAIAVVALGQIGDRRDVPTLARVATDINYRASFPALTELLSIL